MAGAAEWVGLDQKYFMAAVLPAPNTAGCVFFKGPVPGEQGVALRLPIDGKLVASFSLFGGPKQRDLLRSMGRDLDSAIDLGTVANLFAPFSRLLLWVMQILQGFVHSWGLAIILLTVLVKTLLYPLTAKSMASMNEMRKLQPEVEKLKQKFGDDKEKLNLAVMQLYQQHKVNPLGGCLPMLIQMPIWFALYATLQTSVEPLPRALRLAGRPHPLRSLLHPAPRDGIVELPHAEALAAAGRQRAGQDDAVLHAHLLHLHHAQAAVGPDALHPGEQPFVDCPAAVADAAPRAAATKAA